MPSADLQQPMREAQRAQSNRRELAERIAGAVPRDGTVQPIEGLYLHRVSSPTELGHGVSRPAFCVIAQGSKEVWLGETCYRYDPAHFLVVTAALPVAGRVTEASAERPYLGLVLRLDPALVGSVVAEAGHPETCSDCHHPGDRRELVGCGLARCRGPTGATAG